MAAVTYGMWSTSHTSIPLLMSSSSSSLSSSHPPICLLRFHSSAHPLFLLLQRIPLCLSVHIIKLEVFACRMLLLPLSNPEQSTFLFSILFFFCVAFVSLVMSIRAQEAIFFLAMRTEESTVWLINAIDGAGITIRWLFVGRSDER